MKSEYMERLRKIPSVDRILAKKKIQPFLKEYPRKFVKVRCNALLKKLRMDIRLKKRKVFVLKEFIVDLRNTLSKERTSMKKIINATGIILNTNLGRAPLPEHLVNFIQPILVGYSNLEYNLMQGVRGKRYDHLTGLLKDLTGAEDALVVNNNAGAVLLCLDEYARRKEVIVSRGQLIEIGGSYRLPDILKASGVKLVEVGTTNRTYIEDFKNAITSKTKMLLLSHRSNFRMVGFTKDPEVKEVVLLGKARGIVTMMDLGSGLLISMEGAGLKHEPTVQEMVKTELDIISFSGDKLLGGPQAGIILGRKSLVNALRKNPLSRALRVDKFTISALEYILRIYLFADNPVMEIPGLAMAFLKTSVIKKRAHSMKQSLQEAGKAKVRVTMAKGFSEVGGGTLPAEVLPTHLVMIVVEGLKTKKLLELLRSNIPPIIARIEHDRVVMDPRTIFPQEINEIQKAITRICGCV
ncbi:MAG: L-seryl-tRNA(Sec) selenium transferase [Candidatus Cloacimonadota bacterium]|nr:MAG: L-seryl-tRNA(Sec) selenium transferase [Candidatus Cloacimonadota bacterium]